ncbi:MAG TPA: hypothetical protein VMY16_10605 [Ilumatobacteraceae bacterium]|nr:hypothetical protein [Ilumatobacteraceae bacterium]
MQWHRHIGWTPHDLGWRIAALFMVGSSLFAVGAFPPYSQLVDGRLVGITFVVGSLFFTIAAYGSIVQVINDGREPRARVKLWSWSPSGPLWWAAVVQFAGTLLFNINTIDALVTTFTVEETNRLVWAPDFFGCIAFLVASHLAWMQLGGRFWFRDTDDPDWWSSLLNYVGSVFFMASALAAFTLPTTGEARNITIVNSGTFLGAICFLIGAYLLLPPTQPKPAT